LQLLERYGPDVAAAVLTARLRVLTVSKVIERGSWSVSTRHLEERVDLSVQSATLSNDERGLARRDCAAAQSRAETCLNVGKGFDDPKICRGVCTLCRMETGDVASYNMPPCWCTCRVWSAPIRYGLLAAAPRRLVQALAGPPPPQVLRLGPDCTIDYGQTPPDTTGTHAGH
jgi:hypothetical protein